MKAKSTIKSDLQRHLLIGAGLGLYFGWFFIPQREPSIIYPFVVAIMVTVEMFLVRLYQRGRAEIGTCLREAPVNLLQYFVLLLALEARHYAHDAGGRVWTAIFMIILGSGMGALYWWKNRAKEA